MPPKLRLTHFSSLKPVVDILLFGRIGKPLVDSVRLLGRADEDVREESEDDVGIEDPTVIVQS